MSTNQRENERMERKLAKKRKRQKIAWIAIILVIIALLVMKLCEIDFSSVGDKSDSPVSVTGEEAFPFELESGEDFGFGVFSDNIYALNADAFTVIGEADGFLYNMVRIMVGTLLFVSEGKIKSGELSEIIESKNRKRAGKTAPAQGLYLNEIYY